MARRLAWRRAEPDLLAARWDVNGHQRPPPHLRRRRTHRHGGDTGLAAAPRFRTIDTVPIITLTTDFGTRDAYVAAMKGVIMQGAPQATVVDVSHEIEPYNILHGAFVLRHAVPWFPAGTIHLVVVDPGVGSARRILVGRFAGQFVVAPDNGVISLLQRELGVEEMRVVENRRLMLPHVSSTFHGRDIMAPVAAHLATGTSLGDVGPATDHAEVLQLPQAKLDAEYKLTGQLLYTDRFGNLITNIARSDLALTFKHRVDIDVRLDGTSVGPIRNAYQDVAPGEPLALIGSSEMVEIAVHGGSASERFRPAANCPVHVG